MSSAQTSLAPIIEFLRRHAPFDQMAPAHLEFLAKRLRLGFYARNEVIVGPDHGPADRFFIIKQGGVRGELADGAPGEESAFELEVGECFPVGALLSRRPVRLYQRAIEDTFCFELERDDFDQLLAKSAAFHDFCTRRLANLLDTAVRTAQAATATRAAEDTSLSTPLSTLIRRAPITCTPETPVREALERMERERVGSMVAVDGEGRPVGIITLHDVLSRIAVPRLSLATPMGQVMTRGPLTLRPNALAYEAALLMAQHGFGHVCVTERDRLVGVLSERDLFSLQRVGLVSLSRAIAAADSVEALARLGADVHRLVEQMQAQGASVEQLTQIITALNDGITTRVIALMEAQHGKPAVPYTWLAFGSEGRHEQTLRTDQDNGILFRLTNGITPAEGRAELLPFARKVNEALDACGFPLCKGNVMASNPECCLTLEEWQERFGRWINQGTPEHLLNASIYFDFRPLLGDTTPVDELREWVSGVVAENKRFLRQMADNAMRHRPPLGFMRDFAVLSGGDHPNTVDLKVQGLTPFVDGARLIVLAHNIRETNTPERLRAAAAAKVIATADADAWIESYHFIQLLRMRAHRQQAEQGLPLDNHIKPDELNELDRRILREAFRQARKLQQMIALEYQL